LNFTLEISKGILSININLIYFKDKQFLFQKRVDLA